MIEDLESSKPSEEVMEMGRFLNMNLDGKRCEADYLSSLSDGIERIVRSASNRLLHPIDSGIVIGEFEAKNSEDLRRKYEVALEFYGLNS